MQSSVNCWIIINVGWLCGFCVLSDGWVFIAGLHGGSSAGKLKLLLYISLSKATRLLQFTPQNMRVAALTLPQSVCFYCCVTSVSPNQAFETPESHGNTHTHKKFPQCFEWASTHRYAVSPGYQCTRTSHKLPVPCPVVSVSKCLLMIHYIRVYSHLFLFSWTM